MNTDNLDEFNKILRAQTIVYRIIRFMIFAPLGASVGWVFWIVTFEDLGYLDEKWRDAVKWTCVAIFSVGSGAIPMLRCVTLITFVTVFFGEGQAIVNVALMLAMNNVFVQNMLTNMDIAYLVIRCNMQVAQNLSITRERITIEPNRDLMAHLALGSRESRRRVNLLEDVFHPLRLEIAKRQETVRLKKEERDFEYAAVKSEKVEDSWENEKVTEDQVTDKEKEREAFLEKFQSDFSREFTQKTLLRCESIYSMAHQKCVEIVLPIYLKCEEDSNYKFIVPFIGFITGGIHKLVCIIINPVRMCWFFKIIKNRDKSCTDSNSVISKALTDAESELINSAKSAQGVMDQFEVNVQLEANVALPKLKMFSLGQAFARIRANFSWLRTLIEIISFLVKILRLIYVGRVIIIIYSWIKHYMKDVAHENWMVGDQFVMTDNRRKMENKQHFGMLRKFELKRIYTSWFQPKLSKDEKSRLTKGIVQMVYFAIFIYIFTLITSSFYRMLMYAYEQSTFISHQHGYHDIDMHVEGSGFVAKIFKTLIKKFNRSVDVNQTVTNEHCRQLPRAVDWSLTEGVPWIWILFSLLLIQKILAAYAFRLRLLIAAVTFPERDYVRNLWLYNNMLEVRIKKFFIAKDAMESWTENPYLIPVESAFDILSRKYKRWNFILQFFAKQACFICGDKSKGKDPSRYCRYHKVYLCELCLHGYPCFGKCYACSVIPWFQQFEFHRNPEIDYDEATHAGYIICRKTTNSAWQFFVLQQGLNFTDWAPPFGQCKKDEDLEVTAERAVEKQMGLEPDDYEVIPDFEEIVHVLDENKEHTDTVIIYFAAIVDEDSEENISVSERFMNHDWVDIERACKLMGVQDIQGPLLKIEYFLRKYMSK